MRQVARKGLVTAMATGGMLAAAAGYAHADSTASGTAAGSPGVLSGNSVQAPVNIPVNACGNTVNVVGLLNPAFDNRCANASHEGVRHRAHPRGGGATARGRAEGSPGVASGNSAQLPVDVPVNLGGNSVNVVGVGNAAYGNTSVNSDHSRPGHGSRPRTEPRLTTTLTARTSAYRGARMLAHTGTEGLGVAVPASAGMILGGVLLYRRFRPGRS